MDKTPDQEFLEYIVKAIVNFPEEVKTTRRVDEMGVLITLTVNPDDCGRLIGKAGTTAKAIRTILRLMGFQNGSQINLKITDPRLPKSATVEMDEALAAI